MVWDLRLHGDPGGPTPITGTARIVPTIFYIIIITPLQDTHGRRNLVETVNSMFKPEKGREIGKCQALGLAANTMASIALAVAHNLKETVKARRAKRTVKKANQSTNHQAPTTNGDTGHRTDNEEPPGEIAQEPPTTAPDADGEHRLPGLPPDRAKTPKAPQTSLAAGNSRCLRPERRHQRRCGQLWEPEHRIRQKGPSEAPSQNCLTSANRHPRSGAAHLKWRYCTFEKHADHVHRGQSAAVASTVVSNTAAFCS